MGNDPIRNGPGREQPETDYETDRSDRFGHPEDGTDWAHYDENGQRIHGDFLEYLRRKRRERLSEGNRRSDRTHNRNPKEKGCSQ